MTLVRKSEFIYEDSNSRYYIAKNLMGTGKGWIVTITVPETKYLCTCSSVEKGKEIAENYLREQGLI